MKKIILLISLAIAIIAQAQNTKPGFSYQALARDKNGNVLTSQKIILKLSLFPGKTAANPMWVETDTTYTDTYGTFNVIMGRGVKYVGSQVDSFAAVDFSKADYWLKVELYDFPQAAYMLVSYSALLSVPYARVATAADHITKNGKDDIYQDMLDAGLNGIVRDVEDNAYKTIKIGNQVWMTQNLKTTKYNDGSIIPLVTGSTAWAALTNTPGYCWYNNDINFKNPYGALYNWFAVNVTTNGNKNVCPTGWHVPTDAEWTTLTIYLGGETGAGAKLKEDGLVHWTTPNTGATNETGFTALPGGYRYFDGTFSFMGSMGNWWSSSEYTTNTTYVWYQTMYYNYGNVLRHFDTKLHGFSVRCLRDY